MHLHRVYCCHCKPHQSDLKRPAEVEKDLQKYKEAFGSTNLMEALALKQQWTGFFKPIGTSCAQPNTIKESSLHNSDSFYKNVPICSG